MPRRKHRATLLAAFAVTALVAAACSDDDDESESVTGGTGTEAAVTTPETEPPETSPDATEPPGTEGQPDETEPPETTPDGTEPPETTPDGTEPPATTPPSTGNLADRQLPPGESHVEEDEGEPVQGGDLVYGIEADTSSPWPHYRALYATAGYVMLTSVTDALFNVDANGEVAPNLVESYEANDDFTEWTLTVREGITFHDGTPLDGAAVEFNIEACQYAPLTAAALVWLEEVTSEGQTVTLRMREPYVVLPRGFTERSCAYMLSPQWLGSLPDVPQRTEGSPIYDAELAATPADGDPSQPVGLGAFVFESYTPGNGNSFRLVRNEDYWRGPNGITGENLPYLDSIEGVVAVDIDSRANSLRSGEFDIIHTSNPDSINQFLEDDEFETIASSLFGDTNYTLLNVAEGPETDPNGDNADSPLLNVHCRRALAHATDIDRLVEERAAGLSLKANGPFGPGMLGYLEDSGYPQYDPDAAVAEFDTCLSELGTESIKFAFNTTNDPFNVETNQLTISMWQEVLGDAVEATIAPVEQGSYIALAVFGTFEAFAWRNHGGIDPATQAYWWESTSSAPIGSFALNFGRFKDPEIDAAMQTLRSESDPAVRQEAAEEINRIFGEQVYNLWTTWALWSVIEQPYVNGTETNAIVDGGGEGLGLAFSGRHQMNQLWCDGGSCE